MLCSQVDAPRQLTGRAQPPEQSSPVRPTTQPSQSEGKPAWSQAVTTRQPVLVSSQVALQLAPVFPATHPVQAMGKPVSCAQLVTTRQFVPVLSQGLVQSLPV